MSTKFLIGILRLLVGAYIALLVFSCGTVRKSQTTTTTAKDSSRVVVKDSAAISTVDSSSLVKSKEITVRDSSSKAVSEIIIELDSNYTSDRPLKESDYQDSTTNKIRIKGIDFFIGNFKPTRITVRELLHVTTSDSNVKEKFDSVGITRIDSSRLQVKDSSGVKTTETTKTNSKKKSSVPIFIQIGIIALLVLLAIYFLPKKKNHEQEHS
jgi:cobalamin biosynthesis Mg chelatase CobN